MDSYVIISQSNENGLNRRLANKITEILQSEHSQSSHYFNANDYNGYEWDKFIFIIPEWNGTYPFMFKQIVDESGWPSQMSKKKVLLIGTSNGKFGNLMGVNHFEYTLNYVGSSVFTKKVYIPRLSSNVDNDEYIGYLRDVLLEFHLS